MKSTSGTDVKQYNLTSGKSLPEWLDERKRRALLKKDEELRRRLELLQDFDMPSVSNKVQISKDGQFILATGTYKPRIKCFDVSQLGLKFERCFDAEAVAFEVLSDDYSKIAFLHCDRYLELHAQFGKYYRLRVPKFGRDLAYNNANCDLYVVGAGSDVHRLNLEQGRFLNPLTTQSLGLNVCKVNPDHQLLAVGSTEGHVETWDPRSRQKAASLDCAFTLIQGKSVLIENLNFDWNELRWLILGDHLEDAKDQVPQVTSLSFRDGLNLAVGTSTGHILLYDIRSSRPLLVKDHLYGIAIKKVLFHSTLDQVISLDSKTVKVWDRTSGKAYTTIESESSDLNDICAYPGSGLIFLANEAPKMQVHYIPSLGPAPRWCSFLDNITEEIEESAISSVYDDYKFVTRDELMDLGLDHLIGSPYLRAYMHGFFMDARLYRKAHSVMQPLTLNKYLSEKIDRKLAQEAKKRVQLKSDLPKTNQELFVKLQEQRDFGGKNNKKGKQVASELLQDDRFSAMFNDARFEVDKTETAFKLLNPVLSKMAAPSLEQEAKVSDDDDNDQDSDDFADDNAEIEDSDESSDDEIEWTQKVKEAHKNVRKEASMQREHEKSLKMAEKIAKTIKVQEFHRDDFEARHDKKNGKRSKKSLADRLADENSFTDRMDGHQMVFKEKKSAKQLTRERQEKEHRQERLELRRSASSLKKDRIKPKFWNGKRVV